MSETFAPTLFIVRHHDWKHRFTARATLMAVVEGARCLEVMDATNDPDVFLSRDRTFDAIQQ